MKTTKTTKETKAKKTRKSDVQELPPVKGKVEAKGKGKSETPAKGKAEAKKGTAPFRAGTKTEAIYHQLLKGTTFKNLRDFVEQKFGKKSANEGNVRQYIANINEKVTVENVDGQYRAFPE